jgi:hypothetical protein
LNCLVLSYAFCALRYPSVLLEIEQVLTLLFWGAKQ